jgi:hypothetical protein
MYLSTNRERSLSYFYETCIQFLLTITVLVNKNLYVKDLCLYNGCQKFTPRSPPNIKPKPLVMAGL